MLRESDIIQNLQTAFAASSDLVGIGDDAAVLPLNDTESYVISKDILVEHRHFRLATTDAASLAHKSLHVNLSDIAAMGAVPLFVMMGIALPQSLSPEWVRQFMSSFVDACKEQNIVLIGGDTTASERDVLISITVIGKGSKSNLKFRKDAKAGDIICVAGALGEAHAGLVALENKIDGLAVVKSKSLKPTARTDEGIWLGGRKSVTAMMDVSDGLYVDLTRMAQVSRVGAVIDLENMNPGKNLQESCAHLNLDVRECMLVGGEDYALLFTVSAGSYENLSEDFEKRFGYALIKIGVITPGNTVELRDSGKPVTFHYRAFSHFGEL